MLFYFCKNILYENSYKYIFHDNFCNAHRTPHAGSSGRQFYVSPACGVGAWLAEYFCKAHTGILYFPDHYFYAWAFPFGYKRNHNTDYRCFSRRFRDRWLFASPAVQFNSVFLPGAGFCNSGEIARIFFRFEIQDFKLVRVAKNIYFCRLILLMFQNKRE
jgi:hypothetical protein